MTLTQARPEAADFSVARRAMIDSQLRTSGVNEPWVLAAVARVAREDHVPAALRDAAYIDRAIPLASGRMLAAPLVHASMLAQAAPTAQDTVLLVGEAGGYLAALLAPLCGSLAVVDPAQTARGKKAACTLIIIDGAIEHLPDGLADQLAEGGRLVTGVVESGITRLASARCVGGQVALAPLADMGIPILPEFAAPRRWSF